MKQAIIIAVIAATPPTLVALLSFFKSRNNATAIQEVHLSVNSRMDELLAASKGEARAEGHAAGLSEQKP